MKTLTFPLTKPLLLLPLIFTTGITAQQNPEANAPSFTRVNEAHGVTGSLAFVIIWPLGAILIRLLTLKSVKGAIWIHAGTQAFGLLFFIANFGMGVWQGIVSDQIDNYHAIIGIILFGLALCQPVLGLLHHLRFQKLERKTVVTYMHIWLGRLLITLGMINGGLGLLLADNATRGAYIAYGVVAAVIWFTYIAIVAFAEVRTRKDAKYENMKERMKERRDW